MDILSLLYKEEETEILGSEVQHQGMGTVMVTIRTEVVPTRIGRILLRKPYSYQERFYGKLGGPWIDLDLKWVVDGPTRAYIDGMLICEAFESDKLCEIEMRRYFSMGRK